MTSWTNPHPHHGVGALERLTLLNPYITLLAVCFRTLLRSIIYCIYYILLAVICAASSVFAYYPQPGGQA